MRFNDETSPMRLPGAFRRSTVKIKSGSRINE